MDRTPAPLLCLAHRAHLEPERTLDQWLPNEHPARSLRDRREFAEQ